MSTKYIAMHKLEWPITLNEKEHEPSTTITNPGNLSGEIKANYIKVLKSHFVYQ